MGSGEKINGPPFGNPGVCLPGQHLEFTSGGGNRHSCQRPSRPAVYLLSRGRARWGRGTVLTTVTTPPVSQGSVFSFPFSIFLGERTIFRVWVFIIGNLLDMLVANQKPTPCYQDAFSVSTSKWAYWERVLRTTLPTGKGGVVHLFVVCGYQGRRRMLINLKTY